VYSIEKVPKVYRQVKKEWRQYLHPVHKIKVTVTSKVTVTYMLKILAAVAWLQLDANPSQGFERSK
jgi:hypothetical protein